MVNTNKIKGRMKEMELTQADVAKVLNLAQSSLNQKINNIRPFDLSEAEKLAEILRIDARDFGIYFFSRKVAICNQEDREIGCTTDELLAEPATDTKTE